MVIADWIIVAVVVVSTLISLKRGFIKELLSLVIWAGALFIAVVFSERLAGLMTGMIATENWRLAAAFAILFVGTLVVGAMVNHLLGELVRMTGLTATDRLLGVVFGALRGVLIVIAVLAIARLFALDPFWQGSLLVPLLEPLVNWAGEYVNSASARVFDIRNP